MINVYLQLYPSSAELKMLGSNLLRFATFGLFCLFLPAVFLEQNCTCFFVLLAGNKLAVGGFNLVTINKVSADKISLST